MKQIMLYRGCDAKEANDIMMEKYPDVSFWYNYCNHSILSSECVVRIVVMVSDDDSRSSNFYYFSREKLEKNVVLISIVPKDLMIKEIKGRRFRDGEIF